MDINVDLGDHGILPCNVEYHTENDGIGSYEFWGAKCFDSGTDYPVIDKIEPHLTTSEIDAYINDNWDELCEQIEPKIELDDGSGF